MFLPHVFGLSPASLMVTYLDWFAHLMISPENKPS
jgi:hypothetical protein